MNVEGTAVERELGRAIMPRFHAGFSVGTVAGALAGAGMVALGVSVTAHLLGGGVVDPGRRAGRRARASSPTRPHERAHADEPRRSPLKAWTEPRTLLIGLFTSPPRSPRGRATTGSASR